MNNPAKLFVGNLPFKSTREELMQFFAQAGTVVDATILTDKFTGRSRGFGFVEMSSADEALKAKEMLNGKDFQGRALIVNEARPEQPREGNDMGGAQPVDAMPQAEPEAVAETPTEPVEVPPAE